MNEINYFENELLNDLADSFRLGHVEFISNDKDYVALLKKKFRWHSNQIDWKCSDKHENIDLEEFEDHAQALREFINTVILRHSINVGEKVVVSTSSDAIRSLLMDIATLLTSLQYLLEIPEHLYIYPKNAQWCFLCNDLHAVDFGFSVSDILNPQKLYCRQLDTVDKLFLGANKTGTLKNGTPQLF